MHMGAGIMVPVMLALGALVPRLGGGLGAAGSPEAGCAPLAGLTPVAVAVRGTGGSLHRGTGYTSPEGEALVPLRGLVDRAAHVYWDESGRTVSLLGPDDVLSVHFRGARAEARSAVLNGEVITAHAVFCDGQVYLPVGLVAAVLHLEVEQPSAEALHLSPR